MFVSVFHKKYKKDKENSYLPSSVKGDGHILVHFNAGSLTGFFWDLTLSKGAAQNDFTFLSWKTRRNGYTMCVWWKQPNNIFYVAAKIPSFSFVTQEKHVSLAEKILWSQSVSEAKRPLEERFFGWEKGGAILVGRG